MERKYYEASWRDVQYQLVHHGFFRNTTSTHEYKPLIYEENGNYYEFFTGRCLGIEKEGYIWSDDFGRSWHLGRCSYYRNVELLNAESFAEKAQQYMTIKNELIPYVNKYFDQLKANHQKQLEEEKRKQEEAKRKKENAENWLDQMLNNRK